ncbi:MAG: helix-turn-helix domain-containing protein [Eubacterium sp.]|nr:helix-turn-helix domain-containing protein [Eubacterium sp.]
MSNLINMSRSSGFTVIDNQAIRNRSLSLGAKGLLLVILSQHPNFHFTQRRLSELSGDGLKATVKYIKELKEAGYLITRQIKNYDGRFTSNTIYYAFDNLEDARKFKACTDIPFTDNGNTDIRKGNANINTTKDVVVVSAPPKNNNIQIPKAIAEELDAHPETRALDDATKATLSADCGGDAGRLRKAIDYVLSRPEGATNLVGYIRAALKGAYAEQTYTPAPQRRNNHSKNKKPKQRAFNAFEGRNNQALYAELEALSALNAIK